MVKAIELEGRTLRINNFDKKELLVLCLGLTAFCCLGSHVDVRGLVELLVLADLLGRLVKP